MWNHDIAFPLHSMKLKSFSWILWFIRFSGGFHMKSTGFHEIWISHEIHWISWNLHKIRQISHEIRTKSAEFHVKSARFHVKSARNPPDFMKSRMWAFGWSPSIGLSYERLIITKMNKTFHEKSWRLKPWTLLTIWSVVGPIDTCNRIPKAPLSSAPSDPRISPMTPLPSASHLC